MERRGEERRGEERSGEERRGEEDLLARRFIEDDDAGFISPQHRTREAEELALSMRKMQVFDFDVEGVGVLVYISLLHQNIPELDVL
jgi:hypothetical protein